MRSIGWLWVIGCHEPLDTIPDPLPAGDVQLSPVAVTIAHLDTGAASAQRPFEAPFLWQPIPFEGADDLGHIPQRDVDPVPAGLAAFTEIAEAAGLGGSVAGGNRHGVGLGFFDVDGDSLPDILVANGIDAEGGRVFPSALWRNNGDGTFSDHTEASNIAAILDGLDAYSVAAADYDADGDLDVHITAHPTDRLLQNDGLGHFVDATATAGVGGGPSIPEITGWSKIGSWGDIDNDGWMDLAVVSSTFRDRPQNGYLLHNEGDGTFTDWTDQTGFQVSHHGNPCALMWSDYDNDGDQDLHVWNDRGGSAYNRTLMRNEGTWFSDQTIPAGWTQASAVNPMGVDGADTDHDGYLDYYIGNIGNAVFLAGRADGTFINRSLAAGVQGGFTWSGGFEDFNHDGWWDLFVTQERFRDHLSFTNNQTVPATFTKGQWGHGPWQEASHAVPAAFADFDRDGDVDVVVGGTGGDRLNLYRNDSDKGSNHWLEVIVPSVPGTGAYGGIGGRVVVSTPDRTWFHDIASGSGRSSQGDVSARVGLGPWDGADWVAVLWPDGRQSVVTHVRGDRVLMMP